MREESGGHNAEGALVAERQSQGLAVREKEVVRRLHDNSSARLLWQNLINALQVVLWFAAGWTWFHGLWPLTVIAWLAAGHVGHMKMIAFHEASHGLLSNNYWRNEAQGIVVGTTSLVPLSVYRFVHHFHHAHLATERDYEMWPFNKPGMPWIVRFPAAMLELVFGFLYTPLLFLRAVLIADHIPRKQKRRIWAEYGLCIVVWTTVLTIVGMNGWWEGFIVAYLIPAMLGGFFQSLRKYIEHMGLLGDSPLTSTRTVVGEGTLGRLISLTLLNGDYHGAHHVYARVPYRRLPEATEYVYENERYDPKLPIYSSYLQALIAMLPTLANPKIGRQWLDAENRSREPEPGTHEALAG